MIDTHAHVYAHQFAADRSGTLERAFAAGIEEIWLPNIDAESVAGMLDLENEYPGKCRAMMGLHPCSVNGNFEQELAAVEGWLNRRSFLAVGEIGLDFYWSTEFREQQEEAFRVQVGWAKQHGLPIAIHCRNSFAETVALLQPLLDGQLTGIFHCFSGTAADARTVMEMGFYLGIGGVATFKNGGLDQALPGIDPSHLVLETDAPYLAPVPYRGKRNEPAHLTLIAARLGEITGLSTAAVQRITTENARRLAISQLNPNK